MRHYLIPINDNQFKCRICNEIINKDNLYPLTQCKGSNIKNIKVIEPSISRKIYNFSIASIKHIINGMPSCTQEQIDARLDICKSCPLFIRKHGDEGVCGHENCGCDIKSKKQFLSKLGWADQECPIGKWGKIEE